MNTAAKRAPVYYAIVQHDFTAEREDELGARRGDAVTIVAQSNREWLVAKPIGRLGRPGLIPVSFVELRDPATGNVIADIGGLIDRGLLPRVEEWKQAMAQYKENSISVGANQGSAQRTNAPPPQQQQQQQQQQYQQQQYQAFSNEPVEESSRTPTPPEPLPEGALISADVVSFHYEKSEFWFRLDVSFQPYLQSWQNHLPNARRLVLFRVYNDFYDLQVTLLDQFPREAGREPPHPRILPYMPGPTKAIDDRLAAERRVELDDYMHALCDLNLSGYRHILEMPIVREFLTPQPGDVESEIPPMVQELEYIVQQDAARRAEEQQGYIDPFAGSQDEHAELLNIVGGHAIPYHPDQHADAAPPYEQYEQYDRQQQAADPFADNTWQSPHPPFHDHQRAESPYSRTESPQGGLIKIKVFDHASDDLVSIRVQPNVSLDELMDKVQARLGGVTVLQYRDGPSGNMASISDDRELRMWIESAQKHMLYAH